MSSRPGIPVPVQALCEGIMVLGDRVLVVTLCKVLPALPVLLQKQQSGFHLLVKNKFILSIDLKDPSAQLRTGSSTTAEVIGSWKHANIWELRMIGLVRLSGLRVSTSC